MGIEPTLFAWEARVLPLNDTRKVLLTQRKARILPGGDGRLLARQAVALAQRVRGAGSSSPVVAGS